MPSLRPHRLVVLGADRVGKTALIEQLIFGNHVLGQVSCLRHDDLVSQTNLAMESIISMIWPARLHMTTSSLIKILM